MHTRLCLNPSQARSLAKLLRIQLVAHAEAVAGEGSEALSPSDDFEAREWLTEDDLETLAPLLPVLSSIK